MTERMTRLERDPARAESLARARERLGAWMADEMPDKSLEALREQLAAEARLVGRDGFAPLASRLAALPVASDEQALVLLESVRRLQDLERVHREGWRYAAELEDEIRELRAPAA